MGLKDRIVSKTGTSRSPKEHPTGHGDVIERLKVMIHVSLNVTLFKNIFVSIET